MAKLERARDESCLDGCLLGLVNLGEQQDHECSDEDARGDCQCRRGVGDSRFLGDLSDERSHQDVNGHSGRRVERSTNLDELVSGLSSTAQHVEQGIDDGVEHAHAHAADEGTQEVDPVRAITTDLSAKVFQPQSYKSYNQCRQGGLLVAELGDQHTAGYTHQQVCDKVGVVADLSGGLRGAELVFDDGCHG